MVRGNWQRASAGFVGVTGLGPLVAHLAHLVGETPTAAVLTGVVPQALVSLGLLGAAWYLSRPSLEDACFLRVFVWTVLGMVVLAGLGSGLMVYQAAHGAVLHDAVYVAVNWIATGALIGSLVGYYDADRVHIERELRRERDRLREREAQLERENDRLDRFASIVSHDIRNPLNVADGRLELARETGEDAHLEKVADAHDRIATIVDEILTLSRQGDAVDEDALPSVSLEAVARGAWDSVETGDATLVVESAGTLSADERRLRRILENLFANAVEHGSTSPDSHAREDAVEHGGLDVTVRVGWLDDGTGLYVEDDGVGVDDDVALFEAGVTTAPQGTGLGLAIVDGAATAHGWTVAETGATDGGARFEIRGVARADDACL